MSARERLVRCSDRIFDRLRDARAFTLTEDDAADGDLDALRGSTYALLLTFRRNGDAVPSPVWFGLDDAGRAYLKTWHGAGKVKRLRNDARAVVAPCTSRGKPTGAALRATGRIVSESEWGHAEAALAAAYGAGRMLSERLLGGGQDMDVYVELTPRRAV
jgi:PPOX class probable F420-dependent enzyme